MADGIFYDSSNKQLKFTVSGSNVLTLASGSGINFSIPITASSIYVSSSGITSSFTIQAKDAASNSRIEFPIVNTGSFLIETLSGTGDFQMAYSASTLGIKPALKIFRGGTYGYSRISLMTNDVEGFTLDDTGSIFFGNRNIVNGAHKYDAQTGRFGIRTLTPNSTLDVNGNTLISGNLIVTGAVGIGFTSIPNEKLVVSGNIIPSGSGVWNLGTLNYRWNDIYATNGTINTSDRNLKTDIQTSDLGIDFINSLNPVSYKFIDGTRTHYGLIAQEVKDTLDKNNIDTKDFAGFIMSKKQIPQIVTDEYVYLDHELKEKIDTITKMVLIEDNKEYNYALRYTEFISPMIKAIQDLSNKLEELENKLSSSI